MARFSRCSVSLMACLPLLFVEFVGCGPSGPKTYPVTGKVTIDGKPLANCRIDFLPVDSANQAASGQIGADGTYTLYTGTTGAPGAMPGKYKVVLTPEAGDDASYMGGEESENDVGAEPTIAESGVVPKEYMDASTTPKEVEVTAGQNTINIEIQSGASGES